MDMFVFDWELSDNPLSLSSTGVCDSNSDCGDDISPSIASMYYVETYIHGVLALIMLIAGLQQIRAAMIIRRREIMAELMGYGVSGGEEKKGKGKGNGNGNMQADTVLQHQSRVTKNVSAYNDTTKSSVRILVFTQLATLFYAIQTVDVSNVLHRLPYSLSVWCFNHSASFVFYSLAEYYYCLVNLVGSRTRHSERSKIVAQSLYILTIVFYLSSTACLLGLSITALPWYNFYNTVAFSFYFLGCLPVQLAIFLFCNKQLNRFMSLVQPHNVSSTHHNNHHHKQQPHHHPAPLRLPLPLSLPLPLRSPSPPPLSKPLTGVSSSENGGVDIVELVGARREAFSSMPLPLHFAGHTGTTGSDTGTHAHPPTPTLSHSSSPPHSQSHSEGESESALEFDSRSTVRWLSSFIRRARVIQLVISIVMIIAGILACMALSRNQFLFSLPAHSQYPSSTVYDNEYLIYSVVLFIANMCIIHYNKFIPDPHPTHPQHFSGSRYILYLCSQFCHTGKKRLLAHCTSCSMWYNGWCGVERDDDGRQDQDGNGYSIHARPRDKTGRWEEEEIDGDGAGTEAGVGTGIAVREGERGVVGMKLDGDRVVRVNMNGATSILREGEAHWSSHDGAPQHLHILPILSTSQSRPSSLSPSSAALSGLIPGTLPRHLLHAATNDSALHCPTSHLSISPPHKYNIPTMHLHPAYAYAYPRTHTLNHPPIPTSKAINTTQP